MKIAVLKTDKIINFTLPPQIHGNYWITDKNKNGKEDLKKAEWYLNWVGNNSSIKYTKYKEQFIKLSELHEHLVARVDR